MASKTPLALVKEKFGDKSRLVEAVRALMTDELWVSRINENKGLAHVSNAKLLRLHALFSQVKEKFGTREKLIDAILDLDERGKDAGLRQRLLAWPVPRLFDTYRSASKRNAAADADDAESKRSAGAGAPATAGASAPSKAAGKGSRAAVAAKTASKGSAKTASKATVKTKAGR